MIKIFIQNDKNVYTKWQQSYPIVRNKFMFGKKLIFRVYYWYISQTPNLWFIYIIL